MAKQQILLINKDLSSRTMLKYIIETNHYLIVEAKDIINGITLLNKKSIDLTIVDAEMIVDNQAILTSLTNRQDQHTKTVRPVVLLMPENKVTSELSALRSTANVDAIIHRPFSPSDLIKSIETLLSRTVKTTESHLISVAGITINPQTKQVTIDDQPINIGHIEYELLHFFVSKTDKIYSRKNILNSVWGKEKVVDERTVDVHIRKLRKILSPYQYDFCLQTVHGAGYRFISEKLEVL